jgi:hypothetical protein
LNDIPECLGCGIKIPNASENNRLGEEFICDACREEMISSLEGAWKKHSAFLDSALN